MQRRNIKDIARSLPPATWKWSRHSLLGKCFDRQPARSSDIPRLHSKFHDPLPLLVRGLYSDVSPSSRHETLPSPNCRQTRSVVFDHVSLHSCDQPYIGYSFLFCHQAWGTRQACYGGASMDLGRLSLLISCAGCSPCPFCTSVTTGPACVVPQKEDMLIFLPNKISLRVSRREHRFANWLIRRINVSFWETPHLPLP